MTTPSLMMPWLSLVKMLRLSSATANGIEGDTPRWNLLKPSPGDVNGILDTLARELRPTEF